MTHILELNNMPHVEGTIIELRQHPVVTRFKSTIKQMYNYKTLKNLKSKEFFKRLRQLLPRHVSKPSPKPSPLPQLHTDTNRYIVSVQSFMTQDADRGLFGRAGTPTKTSLCSGKGTHKLKKYLEVFGLELGLVLGLGFTCIHKP